MKDELDTHAITRPDQRNRIWRLNVGKRLDHLFILVLFGFTCARLSAGQTGTPVPYPSDAIIQAPQTTNCADPAQAASPLCQASTPVRQVSNDSQVYVDSAGTDTLPQSSRTQQQPRIQDPLEQARQARAKQPTDFERLVRSSTGELLSVYGQDLFQNQEQMMPAFTPVDEAPAASSYIIRPGDQLLVRLSGSDTLNSQLTVDSSGAIYVPKIGAIQIAGLRYDQLQKRLTTEIDRYYRNYTLSVTLGKLRSIQVYVVGEAQRPGVYTVSSLSTVIDALYASHGPGRQGSLRRLELRRAGQTLPEIDLYDFLIRGDKSKDMALEQGDVIVIPPVGPQAALAGSVRHPAIYELKSSTTIGELLADAGGLLPTAVLGSLSLERFGADQVRSATTVPLSAEGRGKTLHDGDILRVDHVTTAYARTVTIRGSLANPGRFSWVPGMRLTNIIPDRMALLTNDYWNQRNLLGVPSPLFEPLPTRVLGNAYDSPSGSDRLTTEQLPEDNANRTQTVRTNANTQALQNSRLATGGLTSSPVPENDTQDPNTPSNGNMHRLQVPVPEIDWSYAVIERLDPNTLKSSLLPFNLGRLVMDHDPSQNLELQPGDIITILSQSDIPVALDQQTKFIRLEGEFVSAGVYSVQPGETLPDVIRRAGGLTVRAYLYGSTFLRDSARLQQQQRLDEYITNLSLDLSRAAASRAANASVTSATSDAAGVGQQRAVIDQLRSLRATGRIVLEFHPESTLLDLVPAIPLENGDVFRVPFRPNTVSVIGAVYGQNVFLYNADRRLEQYVKLAGRPNRIADAKHAFVIRADGSIFSYVDAEHVFSNTFSAAHVYPGDSIVIPEKLIKPGVVRSLLEYSQILSSFGLSAAAINAIR